MLTASLRSCDHPPCCTVVQFRDFDTECKVLSQPPVLHSSNNGTSSIGNSSSRSNSDNRGNSSNTRRSGNIVIVVILVILVTVAMLSPWMLVRIEVLYRKCS